MGKHGKDNIHNLREDAAKVLSDIGNLTKQFADASSEKGGVIKEQLIEQFDEQVAQLRKRLDRMGGDFQQYADTADQKVRKNPYGFIAAALGLGLLLGKLLFPQKR